jgi:hypothetical protein
MNTEVLEKKEDKEIPHQLVISQSKYRMELERQSQKLSIY